MSAGRAEVPDTTVKTPIAAAASLDRIVIMVGLGSIALGSVLTVVAVIARPGVGAFGVVPEALTGLQGMCLGWFAIVLAHPTWGGPPPGRLGWVLVGAGFVATAAVVVVTLDDIGVPVAVGSAFAPTIVNVGRAVITAGLTWLLIVLVLSGLAFLWRTVLGPTVYRLRQ